MNKKTELLARAYFVVMVFGILSAVIAYRVFKVSVVEGDKWRKMGAKNVKWKELNADRGDIYADDGSLLATSLQFFEIRMDMKAPKNDVFNSGVDSLAFYLATTIRKDKSKYEWAQTLKNARKKGNRYLYIDKGVTVDEYRLLKTFPILREGKIKGGLIEVKYGKRTKPFRDLASRTIGEDRENASKIGLEGAFDKFLSGPADKVLQKRLSHNVWVPVYDPSELGARRGDDIVSTINVHLQDVVHEELSKALLRYDAPKGVAILMETETGKIKAISNLANVNGIPREVLNYAIGEKGEPGSTIKLATVLALLEDGKADLDTKVNLNGGRPTKFADRFIRDSEEHGRGVVTMKEAFSISSNIGIATLAHQAYNQSLEGRIMWRKNLEKFGLTEKTGVEIEGEAQPVVKDPVKDDSTWYKTTVPWMAYGYELAMTPLQMLTFYNGVANGGRVMKPYLVSEIKGENGKVKKFEPRVLRERIASPENILKAKEMMEDVVLHGTATNIKSDYIRIAGKTGTTRVNYTKKDEYARYNASFAGYFPAEAPQYSMIIILYEPKGAFYGSAVAAPVFKAIAEKTMAWQHDMCKPANQLGDTTHRERIIPEANAGFATDFKGIFDYLQIPYKNKTDNAWVYVDPFETKMLIEKKKIVKGKVPDVRGMGARDAVYVLENLGLGVAVQGKGKVTRMSLSPGTPIKGQRIQIYLN